MSDPQFLSVQDVQKITASIRSRQERFGEGLDMSVGVVLMNYGERHVRVKCIAGEWSGTKGDLAPRDGVPLCPNGHPLLETSRAPRLALVDEP